MANNIISNSLTPTLTWAAITGATEYQAQFSLDRRFTVLANDQSGLGASVVAAGLSDTKKYYWRFRAKVSGSWALWQPVRSIFINTAHAGNYAAPVTGWVFVDPADLTDFYVFSVAPQYSVIERHKRASQTENIAGDLLVEYKTTRDEIALSHEEAYVLYDQAAEIQRFFNKRKAVYLISVIDYGQDKQERVWKVEFIEDPEPYPIASGREDLWGLTARLQESVQT